MSAPARVWLYAAVVFLSSAALMVLELVAARLIAPYVGVSLYSWTSIIGVVLAGLSLGNWLGGVWADRGADERATAWVLGAGGAFCVASLWQLAWIAPRIQASGLDLISASFLYMVALFFVPAVLIGVVTPLLTTLALRLDPRPGHVVGRMHALAALGSIFGTFVTGYWLVQAFGTRRIIIGCAVFLFLMALPFARRAPAMPVAAVLLAGLFALLAGATDGYRNPCDRESSYFCIRVVDDSAEAPYGEARSLVLDHLVHGINHRQEPRLLLAPYAHLMEELTRDHFGDVAQPTFFAGGGAYTQPRSLHAQIPAELITVAEIDPEVTRVAEQEMFVDTTGMRVVHRDARTVLAAEPAASFAVVVTDVFHDLSVPYHMVTREFAQLVKSRLVPEGLYLVNMVDAHPDPRLVKSLVKTLRREFRHVAAWLHQIPERPARMVYVVSASDSYQPPATLRARTGLAREWYNITPIMGLAGTPLAELPVLSDDYAPVESLVRGLLAGELAL